MVADASMSLQLLRDTEAAGLTSLAEALRRLVDWRWAQLQKLLTRHGGVLDGARLQGQDLSKLGFAKWSLRHADLSNCNLAVCNFSSAVLTDANLSGADLSGGNLIGATLTRANLKDAKLEGALLPLWSSGLMEGGAIHRSDGVGAGQQRPAQRQAHCRHSIRLRPGGCGFEPSHLEARKFEGCQAERCAPAAVE